MSRARPWAADTITATTEPRLLLPEALRPVLASDEHVQVLATDLYLYTSTLANGLPPGDGGRLMDLHIDRMVVSRA